MNFGHPSLLWLLLILPAALVVFFWWALRERQRLMTQFIQARLLPGLISGVSIARQKLRFIFLIAAVVLTIITIARPQWGHTWEASRQKGLDIVVAIDTSKSMLAEDIAPNRLTRAKLAALDLMKLAKSDRLGVVAFAGGAFLQCPLTIDDNAFQQSLDTLDVTTIPQGGTAMGEAIRTALSAFKEGDNYKVLVLFSDGEDNDEGAVEAAEEAAKEGMRIFTIGIGTPDGEILRMRDPKGRTDYIRDDEGNVVKSRLNEGLLQRVASATEGGFYLPLRGAKTIDTLYERGLSPLPKSEGDGKPVRRTIDRYHWPLAAAIVLLLLEMLLPERKRVKESRSQAQAAKTNVPATAAVIALLVWLPVVAGASPATALKDYNAGRYDKAFEEYQRSLAKKQDDPRLHFNAGAAAFRDGRFDEAAKHFNQALPAQDLKLQEQAYYNLGNTLFRNGESIGEPKKMQESWEDALKQYENALRLNTNNADAKFNHDFVKMRLEELKQQQQKQQKQDQQQNKDQNQDKNQENQQDKDKQKDQQQQDKDKQEQQKDDKGNQSQQQQQQAKDDQQKKDEQKSQNPGEKKEQEKKQDQQQAKGDKSGEKSDQDQNAEPQRVAAGAMSPKEAQQLMDAQKGEERVLQFVPPPDPKRGEKKLKDW